MTKSLPRVVIVMPTYNEAANIGKMIDELFEKYFPQIKNADIHLLVVDDNSPDGTGEIVKTNQKKYKNLHLLQGEKAGLGMAYVRGMKYAMNKLSADAVMEMDSDFQHDPKYVKPMVEAFLGGADYAIGTRYIKGGSIPKGWAMHRKAVSYFGNLFARIVLFKPNLHDLTTGFRITKVDGVLNKIDLEHLMALKRFAYKVDLLYQTVNLSKKIVEVPIHFAERVKEASKFSLKEMVATYIVVMKLRIKASQRFIKYGLIGALGFFINAAGLEIFFRLGFTPGQAAAIGAEFAIISNFIFNNFWTFADKKITKLSLLFRKFVEFNFTSAGAIVIQAIVVGIGTNFFGDAYRQLMLVVAVVFFVIPYNYAAYNLLIWGTWKLPFLNKKN